MAVKGTAQRKGKTMAKKLTPAQERALGKVLTGWQRSDQLGESSTTLWVLVRYGYIEGEWRPQGDYFRLIKN